jgi:hypothetical protein
VANVDPEVREALIESDNPPTITEFAEMGFLYRLASNPDSYPAIFG